MQNLIVTGKLPCTKEECATLAAINLRICELNYIRLLDEEEKRHQKKNENCNSLQRSEQLLLDERKKSSEIIPPSPVINTNPNKIDEEDENESRRLASTEVNTSTENKNDSVIVAVVEEIPSAELYANMNLLVLTNGGWESLLAYLRTCSCCVKTAEMRATPSSKFLAVSKLIAPVYQQRTAAHDIMKMIRAKKERLVKTSFYNDEFRLKEFYVRYGRQLACFGCVLFPVQEIIFETVSGNGASFRKVKRLLAINPNKISLIDYKTKALAKSQQMTDLKSWYSGDGYYNLTPMFLLNNKQQQATSNSSSSTLGATGNSGNGRHSPSYGNIFAHIFRLATASSQNSIDMNKLFVIEFRNDYKWHMQIDDFHSLKSITCILLDQSLDMGIDNNPLMLDLTISEHFQNRYEIF